MVAAVEKAAAGAAVWAAEVRASEKQDPGLYLAAAWAVEVRASEKQGSELYLAAV